MAEQGPVIKAKNLKGARPETAPVTSWSEGKRSFKSDY